MYTVLPHHPSPPSHLARSLRRKFLRHRGTYHSRERHKRRVLIPPCLSEPKNWGKGIDRPSPRRTQRAKEIRSNPSPRWLTALLPPILPLNPPPTRLQL